MTDHMTPLARIVPPQVAVLRTQLAGASSSSSLPAPSDQRAQLAPVNTALLLGGFRRCDADDPEAYARTIEHVLARYDVDIQREVTAPGRWQWAPSAWELRQRCETIARERAEAALWDARGAVQLAERRRLDALDAAQPAITDQSAWRRTTAAETRADRERREAERILAQYRRDAEASTRPADPSEEEMWS
jgi:hypothetical protein